MEHERLEDWLSWLEYQHPKRIELGLERVSQVWSRLHPGGIRCPVVTVGGTNGKGSCVAMLEAILRAAGYRTGCYTSPHLRSYNERIRIDAAPVSDGTICSSFERIDQVRTNLRLTYFEFSTLAALDLFVDCDPDVVLLEVGMGGRLDAVNIVDPSVALVTTTGLDHTQWLGHDREAIGREKAGIFRFRRPAVYGEMAPPHSLMEHAEALDLPLFIAGRDYSYHRADGGWDWHGPGRDRTALPLPNLVGEYQLQNAAAVLMVLDLLSTELPTPERAICRGLSGVALEGRFHVIPGPVTVILDVAHNAQAAQGLAEALDALPNTGDTHAVFGVMADKDIPALVETISPAVAAWYLTDLPAERAMPAQALEAALGRLGVAAPISTHSAPLAAFRAARDRSRKGDRILVFGSFVTVGEVLFEV